MRTEYEKMRIEACSLLEEILEPILRAESGSDRVVLKEIAKSKLAVFVNEKMTDARAAEAEAIKAIVNTRHRTYSIDYSLGVSVNAQNKLIRNLKDRICEKIDRHIVQLTTPNPLETTSNESA